MARTNFWVTPHQRGWAVKRENASAASSVHGLKEEAVAAGITLAQNNRPSELIIQNQDGQIGDRRTYGDDPYPPPG